MPRRGRRSRRTHARYASVTTPRGTSHTSRMPGRGRRIPRRVQDSEERMPRTSPRNPPSPRNRPSPRSPAWGGADVDATAGVETSVAQISVLPEKRGITRVMPSCRGKSRESGLRATLVSFGSDQADRSGSAWIVSTWCPRRGRGCTDGPDRLLEGVPPQPPRPRPEDRDRNRAARSDSGHQPRARRPQCRGRRAPARRDGRGGRVQLAPRPDSARSKPIDALISPIFAQTTTEALTEK